MNLSETHTISRSSSNWGSCDRLSKLSKNLYNQALYTFNKEYEETGKFIRYNEMEKLLKVLPDEFNNYKLLTPSVSQQVLMVFDKNIKSFVGLINLWKKDKKKLNGCPKFMNYKEKDGRNIVIIRGDNHVCKYKDGYIHFPSKLNLEPIKSVNVKCQEDLVQVWIVPKSSCYNIEIVYKKQEELNNYSVGKASIDLGVNNLATLVMNSGKSIIYNGKNIKSINKYYNKLKAKKQRTLMICQGKSNSKGLNNLTEKRNRKIKDQLHKISKSIVTELDINKVKNVVIGYNKEWKQGIRLGSKTNQTFVSIPYQRFIDMLAYKCKLKGINVIENEESYTSKASALDLEPVCKHENYKGSRVKRGLFKASNGTLINADVNGGINIGRKVFTDGFLGDIGFVLNPSKKNIF